MLVCKVRKRKEKNTVAFLNFTANNKINKLRLDVHRENNQLATALLKFDEYLEKLPDNFRLTREYKDTQALINRYAKSFDNGMKGIANFADMENIKDKIKALAQEAIKNANENKWLEIGILTNKEIQNINQSTGIDLTGYVRILDMAGINHALRKHGSEKEYLRGQIPVTINDFESIPDIVANPDSVEKVETNKRGLEVILYTKKIGATYYYYEEIRTGRKKVALNTMYKK